MINNIKMNTVSRGTTIVTRSMAKNLASTAAISKDCFEIQDCPNKNMLMMKLNDEYAIVEYNKNGNVYDLVHSEIPNKYQGKGYGKILAEKTFDYVESKNLQIKLTCEFLMSYYNKNQNKYKGLSVESV